MKNGLLREGKLSTKFVGVPLPEMKVSWRQSKQGKGRTKEERALSLNLLGTTYQQNGCSVCTVRGSSQEKKEKKLGFGAPLTKSRLLENKKSERKT